MFCLQFKNWWYTKHYFYIHFLFSLFTFSSTGCIRRYDDASKIVSVMFRGCFLQGCVVIVVICSTHCCYVKFYQLFTLLSALTTHLYRWVFFWNNKCLSNMVSYLQQGLKVWLSQRLSARWLNLSSFQIVLKKFTRPTHNFF